MIRIRPYKREDDRQLVNWFPDEKEFEKWSVGRFAYPLSMEQLVVFSEEMERSTSSFRLAAIDEDGNLVGHFAVRHLDFEENYAYIGYIVVNPAMRGNGMGQRTVLAAVNYCFYGLQADRVTLGVFTNNEKASRCYEAVGFQLEEKKQAYHTYKNEVWDLYQLGIKKQDIL